jgi:putative tryptophan/tyrosine transport system substrate-binding protein
MRRRDFIKVVSGGAAAVWPLVARAQQSVTPVIGFISVATAKDYTPLLSTFLKGLSEAGYVDGRNVSIEYRWAEGRHDRLPAMVADLIHRRVTVIAATTTEAALAAKTATATIPIVFTTSSDPVNVGLVTNLNRPGGNVTGATSSLVPVLSKRLELLHELVPTASVMAALVNPANPTLAENNSKELQAAALTLGLELHVLNASTERDFDGVFAQLMQLRAGGLVITPDPFFNGRSKQLGAMTVRNGVPAIYHNREFAAAGGLLCYGESSSEAYRVAGNYTGRILKGENPGDLPVQQGTKVELYINLKTAKALGITVPLPLSGRADELFE